MAKRKAKGADTTALAPTTGSALAAAANLSDDEQVEDTFPFLGFYSKKSGRSSEIKDAIPGIAEGTAFVYHDSTYKAVQAIQVLDGQRRYFQKADNEGAILAASPTKTDKCTSEMILASVLVYTADEIVPATATFRGTKSRCVSDFIKAAVNTNSTGWEERQGPIGQRLGSLPPRLRVVGYITTLQKTSKDGFTYHLGRCTCKTLNDSQVQLLIDAMGDEDFDANVKECIGKADGRWKWLESEFFGADA